jgi:TPP-dependent pyruvate/acetoin dehydrogenase alpha subunit
MDLSRERLREAYRKIRMIRAFETKLGDLVAAGKRGGFMHLYAGEEAVAVGVGTPLSEADTLASTHRGPGHCIAKRVDVAGRMAELFRPGDRALQRQGVQRKNERRICQARK